MTDLSQGNSQDDPFAGVKVANNAVREAAQMIPVTQRGVAPQDFAQMADRAKFMAKSLQAVPKHLRENIGMCIAIHEMAMEFGFRPYALANHCYVVNDRLGFEAGLMIAVINKHAGLKQRLRPLYEGEGENRICIIRGHFADEADPCEYRSPKIGTITPKSSPLWKVDPDRQLFYFAARAFVRMYAPHVMAGIFGQDELQDHPHLGPDSAKDVTPAAEALHARLAEAAKSGSSEGFRENVVQDGLSGGLDAVEKAADALKTVAVTEADQAGQTAPAGTAEGKKRGRKKGVQVEVSVAPGSMGVVVASDNRDVYANDTITVVDSDTKVPEEPKTEISEVFTIGADPCMDPPIPDRAQTIEPLPPLVVGIPAPTVNDTMGLEPYYNYSLNCIDNATDADALRTWWKDQKTNRSLMGVMGEEQQNLLQRATDKVERLKGEVK